MSGEKLALNLEEVSFEDPRAARLRDLLNKELLDRYATEDEAARRQSASKRNLRAEPPESAGKSRTQTLARERRRDVPPSSFVRFLWLLAGRRVRTRA